MSDSTFFLTRGDLVSYPLGCLVVLASDKHAGLQSKGLGLSASSSQSVAFLFPSLSFTRCREAALCPGLCQRVQNPVSRRVSLELATGTGQECVGSWGGAHR